MKEIIKRIVRENKGISIFDLQKKMKMAGIKAEFRSTFSGYFIVYNGNNVVCSRKMADRGAEGIPGSNFCFERL